MAGVAAGRNDHSAPNAAVAAISTGRGGGGQQQTQPQTQQQTHDAIAGGGGGGRDVDDFVVHTVIRMDVGEEEGGDGDGSGGNANLPQSFPVFSKDLIRAEITAPSQAYAANLDYFSAFPPNLPVNLGAKAGGGGKIDAKRSKRGGVGAGAHSAA